MQQLWNTSYDLLKTIWLGITAIIAQLIWCIIWLTTFLRPDSSCLVHLIGSKHADALLASFNHPVTMLLCIIHPAILKLTWLWRLIAADMLFHNSSTYCSHLMTRILHSQTGVFELPDTESQTAEQLPPLNVKLASVVCQWREHIRGIERTRAAIDFKYHFTFDQITPETKFVEVLWGKLSLSFVRLFRCDAGNKDWK